MKIKKMINDGFKIEKILEYTRLAKEQIRINREKGLKNTKNYGKLILMFC